MAENEVVVVIQSNRVVATTTVNAVNLTTITNQVMVSQAPPNTLTVASPGPQGPPGPPGQDGADGEDGAPGLPGGSWYEHVQDTPAGTWTINHNLGRRVHVTIFATNGVVVLTDIDQSSENTAVLTFASPFAGSATLS